jgi:phosphoribosylaminoimidazole carboxylase PurE protein
MKSARVAILMGSASDEPVMSATVETLKRFGVEHELHVLSAHRTPDKVSEFASNASRNGVRVIICGAGMAAHLAGAVAAHTTLPVIGVPLDASLSGLDSLLSTSQMPSGVPVATVSIGKAGAVNAAVLAVQILALSDEALAEKLAEYKASGSR